MNAVIAYLKSLTEDAVPVNTISGGAVATTPTPAGKVQKRKVDESDAYEGENPLADNIGKFPLTGVVAPEVDTGGTDNGHMFRMKQDQSGYTG